MWRNVEDFTVKVGVHRESALSLYLFSLIMDELTESVQDKALRIMMFADDVVLADDNTNVLQGKHERWQEILEKKQTENKWPKTEFLEFRFKNKV